MSNREKNTLIGNSQILIIAKVQYANDADAGRRQCRRQSKRSEGALKLAELLHIKTDLAVRLQIIRNFESSLRSCLKKTRIRSAAFLSLFCLRPVFG